MTKFLNFYCQYGQAATDQHHDVRVMRAANAIVLDHFLGTRERQRLLASGGMTEEEFEAAFGVNDLPLSVLV